MQFRQRKAFRALLKYKNNHTLSQGGLDIGLKVGILAEITLELAKYYKDSVMIAFIFERSRNSK